MDAGRATLFVGPEGGWTDGELSAFDGAGIRRVSLGPTILRIETAAPQQAAPPAPAPAPAAADELPYWWQVCEPHDAFKNPATIDDHV